MKAYEYRYTGLWLGGTIIVAARSEGDARALAAATITKHGYDPATLKLNGETPIKRTEATVLYDWDGNY